jgi:hypothetical protein
MVSRSSSQCRGLTALSFRVAAIQPEMEYGVKERFQLLLVSEHDVGV